MSLSVGYTLGKTFVPDFETWSVEEQEAFAERIDYPVRKCAYAASDEFHQLFVPGRAGRVTDVLIDSGGVIFGLFVVFVVSWMKNLKLKR